MRWSWNLSIEPTRDHKVYLVVDGFDHNGRIFPETDVETTVTDLMSEQYVARGQSRRTSGRGCLGSYRAGDFAPC